MSHLFAGGFRFASFPGVAFNARLARQFTFGSGGKPLKLPLVVFEHNLDFFRSVESHI